MKSKTIGGVPAPCKVLALGGDIAETISESVHTLIYNICQMSESQGILRIELEGGAA